MATEFVRFGTDHLVALVTPVAVAAVLALLSNRDARFARTTRTVLAVSLLAIELGWLVALLFHYNVGWKWALPLQISDAAILLTVFVIFTLRQSVFDIVYYWGLTAVPLAMLMPDILEPFPDPYTIIFFVLHGLVVAILLYLLWSRTLRPTPSSAVRSFLCLNALMFLALAVNALLGTNYMYLMQKPQQPSLLDYFGPWPLYILVSEGVTILLFGLLSLPYRKGTKTRQLRSQSG